MRTPKAGRYTRRRVAVDPAQEAIAPTLSALQLLDEQPPAFSDQVRADMAAALISIGAARRFRGKREHLVRDLLFRLA